MVGYKQLFIGSSFRMQNLKTSPQWPTSSNKAPLPTGSTTFQKSPSTGHQVSSVKSKLGKISHSKHSVLLLALVISIQFSLSLTSKILIVLKILSIVQLPQIKVLKLIKYNKRIAVVGLEENWPVTPFVRVCSSRWALVVYAFNPILGRERQVDVCEFRVSLVYRMSSLTPELHEEAVYRKKEKNQRLSTLKKHFWMSSHQFHHFIIPILSVHKNMGHT